MIRPIHNSDHTVSADGTLELRGLTPGKRVHVRVENVDQNPARSLGFMQTPGFKLNDPFEPACDPDDWEANR